MPTTRKHHTRPDHDSVVSTANPTGGRAMLPGDAIVQSLQEHSLRTCDRLSFSDEYWEELLEANAQLRLFFLCEDTNAHDSPDISTFPLAKVYGPDEQGVALLQVLFRQARALAGNDRVP